MMKWYHCPVCREKILKVDPTKHFEGVYIKCKRCRQEIEIKNIESKPEPEPTTNVV